MRGSRLRSGAPPWQQNRSYLPSKTTLAHPHTPTHSRREREQKASCPHVTQSP